MNVPYQIGAPGFQDPVAQSQATFRHLMDAIAHPALPRAFTSRTASCGPLSANATAVLLTLVDQDTPLWLDQALASSDEVRNFVAFHCGAPLLTDPSRAAFAFFADAQAMSPLTRFALGEPDYPDRSTTIVAQVDCFSSDGPGFSGPGVSGARRFGFNPAPADFSSQWALNSAGFPLGLDIFLIGSTELAALPRSLRLTEV